MTSSRRLVCGVDLGVTGAVAFLELATGDFVRSFPMPVLKHHPSGKPQVDVCGLRSEFLSPERPAQTYGVRDVAVVAMEAIGVFGPHARKSVLSFGRGTGRTEAFFELQGYAIRLVGPKVWKADVLRGTAKDKAAAVAFARFRWPSAPVGDDHDLADALCLAEHVRRQLVGATRVEVSR